MKAEIYRVSESKEQESIINSKINSKIRGKIRGKIELISKQLMI